ncbi:MAG TPA: TIM barrel protein, partial [Candidatus Limnocylindrales bacterium]|nr:TIM barrel protein [Candidatus Limnocylindrales bacterium]
MLANGRRIGAHLPLGEGMVKAADRAAEIGASAIQVFTDNPTAWRRRPTLPGELPAFRERLAAHDVTPVSIHAPYLVNLAGPEPAFHAQSIVVLAHELRVARAYGAAFVNVHIGSHRGDGTEAGIERLATGLGAVFAHADAEREVASQAENRAENGPENQAENRTDAPTPILVLENGSGGGFGLGSTIEQLARIEAALVAAGIPKDRFGYCLDTAHLWGAGYPIDTAAGVDAVIGAFDAA